MPLWVKQNAPKKQPKPSRRMVKVGDHVRLSKVKNVFGRGFLPNWTEEVYTVTQVLNTRPIQIKVKDYNDDEVEGSFYIQEVQVVDKPETYRIEKIIRTRKVAGKTQYFVKWLGYPASFNSWVDNVESLVKT